VLQGAEPRAKQRAELKDEIAVQADLAAKKNVAPEPGQPAAPGTIMKPEMFDSFISRERMSVNIIDIDSLYSGAEHGMTNCQPEDMAHMETMKWLRDESVKNVFSVWGHNPNKDSLFPTKKKIVQHLVKQGAPVPRYLLPEHHPQCIPPHIVVMELTRREAERCNSSELKGDEA